MVNIWNCLSTPYIKNKPFYNIDDHSLLVHYILNTHQPNYCTLCNATVIKLINFDICNKMEYTGKIFNLRKYKHSDSVKITGSKSLANNLTFSKNISIIESEVNQTQW